MHLQASARDVRLMHVPVGLCHIARGPSRLPLYCGDITECKSVHRSCRERAGLLIETNRLKATLRF